MMLSSVNKMPLADVRAKTKAPLLFQLYVRGDEAFGYFFSLRPPGDIVDATLALQEPHPVGSYLLQHGWLALAGHSEYALRFLSVWWSVLAVALLAGLARALSLAPMSGLLAALPSLGDLAANVEHSGEFGFARAATETPFFRGG